MKLDKRAFGLAAGILAGMGIFLMTNLLLITGSEGNLVSNLRRIYFGYSLSFLGSLLGLVWGFVDGFIVGWIFAFLYNLFVCSKS
ncbi:MAG: bacteriophage holin [Candidatus Aminicenantes bacterium]|nr:bacteriophage holin [Candidatus Aminicenantes bacterium]